MQFTIRALLWLTLLVAIFAAVWSNKPKGCISLHLTKDNRIFCDNTSVTTDELTSQIEAKMNWHQMWFMTPELAITMADETIVEIAGDQNAAAFPQDLFHSYSEMYRISSHFTHNGPSVGTAPD